MQYSLHFTHDFSSSPWKQWFGKLFIHILHWCSVLFFLTVCVIIVSWKQSHTLNFLPRSDRKKVTLNFDPCLTCIPINASLLPFALCPSARVLSLNPLYQRFANVFGCTRHGSVCLLHLHLSLSSSLCLQRVFTMTKDFISLHCHVLWSPFSSSACLTLYFHALFFFLSLSAYEEGLFFVFT